jgi:streptothricin acetyltransferase
MLIERVRKLSAAALENADFSVRVGEKALPPFNEDGLARVITVPAYDKVYPRDDALYEDADDSCRMIATASIHGSVVGYVAVSRCWNGCAQIDDIMISRPHRGSGLGRALMNEAVSWAKEKKLPIVRLETQDTNVPACRFYERYGFKLGGFDRYLYDALEADERGETALFWYLHLG